jgi:hypothetical protein
MSYNKELVENRLSQWESYLAGYSLPAWDSLPNLELYMDQVIVLLTQYLEFLPYEENEDKVITSSIINNYVRMKVMPPPIKKRYSRVHIAYLIIICTLKQSLNISYIQKMLPLGLKDDEVKQLYNDFVSKHKTVTFYFLDQINAVSKPVLNPSGAADYTADSLVLTSAIASNLYKLLTERLVMLQSQDTEDNADDKENKDKEKKDK